MKLSKLSQRRGCTTALSLLLAISVGKLVDASYIDNFGDEQPADTSYAFDTGTSDNWVTGWTYVSWAGSSATSEARTYREAGSGWLLEDHQQSAIRTSVSTGRLHESSIDNSGFSKLNITGTGWCSATVLTSSPGPLPPW